MLVTRKVQRFLYCSTRGITVEQQIVWQVPLLHTGSRCLAAIQAGRLGLKTAACSSKECSVLDLPAAVDIVREPDGRDASAPKLLLSIV